MNALFDRLIATHASNGKTILWWRLTKYLIGIVELTVVFEDESFECEKEPLRIENTDFVLACAGITDTIGRTQLGTHSFDEDTRTWKFVFNSLPTLADIAAALKSPVRDGPCFRAMQETYANCVWKNKWFEYAMDAHTKTACIAGDDQVLFTRYIVETFTNAYERIVASAPLTKEFQMSGTECIAYDVTENELSALRYNAHGVRIDEDRIRNVVENTSHALFVSMRRAMETTCYKCDEFICDAFYAMFDRHPNISVHIKDMVIVAALKRAPTNV